MILGIEIGGTKLQLGVGDGTNAELVELQRFEVERRVGADGILHQITHNAPELIEKHGVTAVGIGFGGPVDPKRLCVIKSHQVHGWDGLDLGEYCRDVLRITPVLGNDCNVAALAEARLGAGQGVDRVFYVTVGTGIGGGLVLGGQIDGAERPAASEVGHLRPGLQMLANHDTVESYASGLGIETRARRLLKESRYSAEATDDLLQRCGHEPLQLTAKAITEAALQGNELAKHVFDQAIQTLGWAIAQVITLAAPQRVVVGGGVSLIGDTFFDRLRTATQQYEFAPLAGSYEIVPAALGELTVVHGAIQLARE